MADKEPIAWVTRGGKHIPIFDNGPSDDEKQKERQIKESKKQADEKNGKKYSSEFETSGNVDISEAHWKEMAALRKQGIHNFMDTEVVDKVDKKMRELGDKANADIVYLYDKMEDDITEDEMYAIYHLMAKQLKL